jgi:large subunit ribosomal protein L21
MYAIIRAGGKQAKVQSGDVIDIERVKGDASELTFAPLLVVDDKGNAVSDRSVLAKASVSAKVLGESSGPKIDIYKYKNKTGYSRRQGHRQKYTRIEITGIKLPSAIKAKEESATKASAAQGEEPESTKPAKSTAKPKATAAKAAAEKKAPAAKPKAPTAKAAEKKASAAKASQAKSAAKKPASKSAKADSPEEE